MGNHPAAYEKWIRQEFNERCKDPSKYPPYLLLGEILNFKKHQEHPLDPSHLATLFVLDQKKDGKFYFDELMNLAILYSEKLSVNTGAVDPVKDFQGYCTLCLWSSVSSPNGDKKFVEWFTRLLSHGMITSIQGANTDFVDSEAIKLIYELLQIDKTYGLDYLDFFDLIQRVGEEMKLTTLDNTLLDDVVPIEVIKSFANEFINGFINYMIELEFESEMELS